MNAKTRDALENLARDLRTSPLGSEKIARMITMIVAEAVVGDADYYLMLLVDLQKAVRNLPDPPLNHVRPVDSIEADVLPEWLKGYAAYVKGLEVQLAERPSTSEFEAIRRAVDILDRDLSSNWDPAGPLVPVGHTLEEIETRLTALRTKASRRKADASKYENRYHRAIRLHRELLKDLESLAGN